MKDIFVSSDLIGAAGEYFVLSQLCLKGMLASLAPRNAKAVDILVLEQDETIIATVQVKTRTYGADGGWHMRDKHEHLVGERFFYAFVDFEPKQPATYIVPSKIVADVLSKTHKAWLKLPGKGGKPHNDTDMRRLLPRYGAIMVPDYPDGWLDCYREAWSLLKSSGTEGRAFSPSDTDR